MPLLTSVIEIWAPYRFNNLDRKPFASSRGLSFVFPDFHIFRILWHPSPHVFLTALCVFSQDGTPSFVAWITRPQLAPLGSLANSGLFLAMQAPNQHCQKGKEPLQLRKAQRHRAQDSEIKSSQWLDEFQISKFSHTVQKLRPLLHFDLVFVFSLWRLL